MIEIAGERIEGILRTYGDRPTGTLIALIGSSGWVEVAVANGDAARQLTAGAGTTVWVAEPLKILVTSDLNISLQSVDWHGWLDVSGISHARDLVVRGTEPRFVVTI